MAEKQRYITRLYNADASEVSEVETDEDLMMGDYHGHMIEAGGKSYIWNQRYSRWQEAEGAIKVGKANPVEVPEEKPIENAQPSTSET